MKRFNQPRWLSLVIATLSAVALLVAGAAIASHYAGHRTISGGALEGQQNQTDSGEAFFSASTTDFVTVPGTPTTVFMASNDSDLIDARFVGGIQLAGTGRCYARIVAVKGSTFVELHPRGEGQILDSSPGATEMQTLERSSRLGGGLWSVRLQLRVSNSNTVCVPRTWHFAVEQIG
jgi:hypothetical protein